MAISRIRSFALLTFIFLLPFLFIVEAVAAQPVNGFNVAFGGRMYDSAANQTTFTYVVSGTGVPPDLSHFVIEIPTCPTPLAVVAYNPTNGVSFGVDPTTGVNGIKWEDPLQINATRTYSITFAGNVIQGSVIAEVESGNGFATITVPGPSCAVAKIDIEKFISADGLTWQDADSAPGPSMPPGTPISFRFVVTNTGNVDLNALALSDNTFTVSNCAIPAALPSGAFFECIVGPLPAADGQHTNIGTATGTYNGTVVSDTDSANYFGGVPSPTMTATFTPTHVFTATPLPVGTVTPDGSPVTFVIEGPVQAINVNIITIYDINVVLANNDPILKIVKIGDIIHVEGLPQENNGNIVIIAVNLTIINVDINPTTGEFWRDNGTCSNPPPAWASAYGWRRRCANTGNTGGVVTQPGGILVIPPGCKMTSTGNNKPHLKCEKDKDKDKDKHDD